MWIIERRNIRCSVYRWYSHLCVHRCLLSDEVFPLLVVYVTARNSAWFQQDGSRPHTSNTILRFYRDVFEDTALSNRYSALFKEGFSWLSTSPDYFLLVCLKNMVLKKFAHNSGTENFHPIRKRSNLYKISNQGCEQFCSSFACSLWLRSHHMKNVLVQRTDFPSV
jgi:hypothetical protein